MLLQVFAPERAVAVSALAGDPSPSLSTARDRRRHRLVARRRSRRPPADETNNPTPDPRLTRGMSKLVTRAASRALGTARRAGVTSRPSPRPTTAFAPSRADPRVDGGTRPTWHQHHHHPGTLAARFDASPTPAGPQSPRRRRGPSSFQRGRAPARSPRTKPRANPPTRPRSPSPNSRRSFARGGNASADARRNSSTASSPRAEAFPIARAPTPRPPTPHLTSRRSRRTRRRVCRVRRPRLLRDRRGLVRQNARLACAGRSPTRLHRLGVPT